MKKILPPLLLALALVCGFTACGSPDFITAGLKVELTSIERTDDGAMRIAWHVRNPNVFPYLLHRTSSKITLDGTLVGTLTDEAPLGVPAQSEANRSAVLKPVNPAAVAALNQAVARGSAAYRVDTVLTVLLLDDKFEKIPLNLSGTVPVTAAAK